ncbi:MAG: Membrane protein [uncultured bacterium]|nr:MAG: Membrane protein [uncultured bacterium]
MNKSMATVLLIAGVTLLVFGLNAYRSAGSEVSIFFTGAPTDKALVLLISGMASCIIGYLGLVRK